MTDTTRIAVIGAAGWAGRQVPMIGLRSPIRVGSSLGHTASATGASPGRRIRTAFCSGADIECSPVIRWTCRESRVCAVTSWHRDHAPQAIRAALTDRARGGPLPRAPWPPVEQLVHRRLRARVATLIDLVQQPRPHPLGVPDRRRSGGDRLDQVMPLLQHRIDAGVDAHSKRSARQLLDPTSPTATLRRDHR